MENKLRCLIVDDEPLALEMLERYVRRTPFLELVQACSSAVEALEMIQQSDIQLIFLDIQMPDLSGMELSRLLDKHIKVVFTTAFHEYALEGYKVNALDYLLKPYNYEEFLRAATRAVEWFQQRTFATENHKENRDYIFVKSEYKLVKIDFNQVIYFEGLKDYIKIITKNNPKAILTLMSLKTLESILPASSFMRIHRSYIIALNEITAVERNQVIMSDKLRITVADQYKERFQEYLSGQSVK
ncbi:MAG TPA: LytTR family DNA-binding domain-containing protein [Bacteroidales bacterium]|nr:LytTR family DNA-binding domain-containing protein [Bacteroidales bacterium]